MADADRLTDLVVGQADVTPLGNMILQAGLAMRPYGSPNRNHFLRLFVHTFTLFLSFLVFLPPTDLASEDANVFHCPTAVRYRFQLDRYFIPDDKIRIQYMRGFSVKHKGMGMFADEWNSFLF